MRPITALSPLLPRPLRFELRRAVANLRDAMEARTSPPRPVFEARVGRTVSPTERAPVRTLEVARVVRSTSDSATITLVDPAGAPIRFTPGQYLTVEVDLDGARHSRHYSFCSDPADERAAEVTVRRVPGGRVSGWLVEHAVPGMLLRTVGPNGRFGTSPRPEAARHVVLVAGGAGITPLLSIARALARAEPRSRVDLVYANRGVTRIILREVVEALAESSGNVSLRHVLERPSKSVVAERGRLSGATLARAVPVDVSAEYYLCGPPPMMDAVTDWLRSEGVPPAQIATERFLPADAPDADDGVVHEVVFARSGVSLQVSGAETILAAGRAAGLPLAFSCGMGGCAACKVTIRSGEVHMTEPNCLSPEEASRGEVLACVARPRSPLVIEA